MKYLEMGSVSRKKCLDNTAAECHWPEGWHFLLRINKNRVEKDF